MAASRFTIEVRPRIPPRLSRLVELADDLVYAWDRDIRGLFARLDPELWRTCGHNPRVFLRRVPQQALEEAQDDRGYMDTFNRAMSVFDSYRKEPMRNAVADLFDPAKDCIAYFCAEYGLHESLPIYSGGLGILAGDHCKAASDLGLPFVAVGLLYRQGYFEQSIDGDGQQLAQYSQSRFEDLPIKPVFAADGEHLQVSLRLPGRDLWLRIWSVKVGHITLYLLDSDIERNGERDRAVTYQLYGGDRELRLRQEMVLGIGGVRALRALGRSPGVWHVNEGHAAFQVLERCREQVAAGLSFDAALELVASGTVFTTHTPVTAGHDIFDPGLIDHYFAEYLPELNLSLGQFQALGRSNENHDGFNMTAFALRGSRFHNSVSRIHGEVTSRMESYIWPQVSAEDNPITYITNGVHAPTFFSREWTTLLDSRFGEWRAELLNPEFWACIDQIPDHRFWSLRQELKSLLLRVVKRRLVVQHRRNGMSQAQLDRTLRFIANPEADLLVIGFARRFATYKRATLLFRDEARLAKLLNRPNQPVVLLFAGKAHPHDQPGQALVREIHRLAQKPEFIGRVLLVENYDLALARPLVSGVDVWLNTPTYPLEASGTSGQKAAMNGVINLSVLDGWWGEGYDGDNGWAILPHAEHFGSDVRDREEANDLYDLLEHRVLPLYFERDNNSYSPGWVRMAKASMKSIVPRFNAERMVVDYVNKLYAPARDQMRRLAADGGAGAKELLAWKQRIRELWGEVSLRPGDQEKPERQMVLGEALPLKVLVRLNRLDPDDVRVECLLGGAATDADMATWSRHPMMPDRVLGSGETEFSLDLKPGEAGLKQYAIRVYPWHRHLSHAFEMGCMLWL